MLTAVYELYDDEGKDTENRDRNSYCFSFLSLDQTL